MPTNSSGDPSKAVSHVRQVPKEDRPLMQPGSTESTNGSSSVKFRGAGNPLSNFYQAGIEVWGIHFASNEHAYQYRKATEMGQHVTAEEIQ